MPYFTDRTRQEQYQKCNRSRFLSTEYGGVGLSPVLPDLDMTLGSALHKGAEIVIKNGDSEIDTTVAAMNSFIDSSLSSFFPTSLINPYKDLSEGLIRAFCKGPLPRLLAKYKILAVEQEEIAFLTDDIVMAGRPDAILQDKSTKEHGILSLKSTSTWDDSRELEAKFDNQGITETWLTEEFLKQTGVKVGWVQMLWIITGPKEEAEGGKIHNSPVFQGWVKETGLGQPELAHSYRWKDNTGGHTLGKGWTRFNVSEMYGGGIKRWIDDLAARKIQPALPNPLDDLFKYPPAWYRRDEEIHEWLAETKYQEDSIKVASRTYNVVTDGTKDFILSSVFRKNRKACIYLKKKCPFIPICWGTAGEAEDPFHNGFKWRTPNHPIEVDEEVKE